MARESGHLGVSARRELDPRHVGVCGASDYVLAALKDAFGEQESNRKLAIVPGGAHRHRHARYARLALVVPREANLERLFDRERIELHARSRSVFTQFAHRNARRAWRHATRASCVSRDASPW